MELAGSRDIHETLKNIPETLKNIQLSSQLAPFSRIIPKNIPGNIPILARAFRLFCQKYLFSEAVSFSQKF